MSKYKRMVVGDVVKGKEGKPDYIKVSNDVVLKKGDFLNLESKSMQLKNIKQAVKDGKLSSDVAEGIMEKINKIPDFVRFNIVKIERQD